jgi:outer membrane usher protein
MSSRGCAAGRRRARQAALTLMACFLAGAAAQARALEELRLRPATELAAVHLDYEELIAEVFINGQRRGEFTVYRDTAGDYYFKAADAEALGLAGSFGSAALVAVRSLGPSEVAFDERHLALRVMLPAASLRSRVYDLTPPRPDRVVEPSESAAFVNYRLAAIEERSGTPIKLALANEFNVRQGGVLFRNEAALLHDGSNHAIRYATQLVYDRREEQQRVILGDQTATSGELGSTLPLGGVGFYKLYQMTPYLMRQPLAGFAGTAATPSQVEVRLGGVPVFREQVAPGPFEVRNLQNFAGARDVEVVVRDALGREQVLGFPYYFADQALRAGLHEYAYSLGALREDLGERNGAYGAGVFSGFHRYGLNDRLTVGLRGEAAQGVQNFGPTVLYRSDRLGALSAGVSASRSDGQGGSAFSLGHIYQSQRFGVHAMARRFSDGYATAQDLIAPSSIRSELAVGASVTDPRWGTVSLDRATTERRSFTGLPQSTLTQLGYTYSFGSRASLFATLSRTVQFQSDVQFFVGVLLTLDRANTLHLSAHRENGGDGFGAQLARAVPAGEGLGYRVGYNGGPSSATGTLDSFVQYNARTASVSLDASAVRADGVQDHRVEAAVFGAATYAGSRFALSRQIDDSFVAVQLAAPVEGVRVYSNNQEIGRTDRDGQLIVPRVGSFYETQVSIDERDVPLDYTLGEVRRVVAPPYRSGSRLAFDVRRLHAVEGTILVRSRGEVRRAENAIIDLEDGRQFETGTDGRYYVEDLGPGEHIARLQADGRDCRFKLVVPASEQSILTLPEVIACD